MLDELFTKGFPQGDSLWFKNKRQRITGETLTSAVDLRVFDADDRNKMESIAMGAGSVQVNGRGDIRVFQTAKDQYAKMLKETNLKLTRQDAPKVPVIAVNDFLDGFKMDSFVEDYFKETIRPMSLLTDIDSDTLAQLRFGARAWMESRFGELPLNGDEKIKALIKAGEREKVANNIIGRGGGPIRDALLAEQRRREGDGRLPDVEPDEERELDPRRRGGMPVPLPPARGMERLGLVGLPPGRVDSSIYRPPMSTGMRDIMPEGSSGYYQSAANYIKQTIGGALNGIFKNRFTEPREEEEIKQYDRGWADNNSKQRRGYAFTNAARRVLGGEGEEQLQDLNQQMDEDEYRQAVIQNAQAMDPVLDKTRMT